MTYSPLWFKGFTIHWALEKFRARQFSYSKSRVQIRSDKVLLMLTIAVMYFVTIRLKPFEPYIVFLPANDFLHFQFFKQKTAKIIIGTAQMPRIARKVKQNEKLYIWMKGTSHRRVHVNSNVTISFHPICIFLFPHREYRE